MKQNRSNGQMTAQVNIGDISKGGFDLSFNNYGTGKIGRIIPTRAQAVHPGDSIKCDSKVAVQFEPLAVPMLANMEVKQEHFYVPYNTVWQEWDEFISGGEQLDYSKVVPNFTLRYLLEQLFNNKLSGVCRPSFLFANPITTIYPNADVTLIRFNNLQSGYGSLTQGMLSEIDSNFINLGERNQAKDLVKYYRICLNNLLEYGTKFDNTNDYPVLFYTASTEDVDAYKFYDFLKTHATDIPSFSGMDSKYILEYEDWYRSQGLTTSRVCVPTNEGVKFCSLLYDFIKPLVGLGSNLDYLNIQRVTLSDFVYMVSQAVANPSDGLELINITEQIKQARFRLKFGQMNNDPISILNLRANYFVWYQNYRDVLLETEAAKPIKTTEVTYAELETLILPRQRCWAKDAFTTALDNPGTGNVGVVVEDRYYYTKQDIDNTSPSIEAGEDNANIYKVTIGNQEYRVPTMYLSGLNNQSDTSYSNVGFSLFQLDAAQRAQKWIQKALYFGNRINDFFYLHFKVKFLDARLRLPELLHSSSDLVEIDTIMNNTNITTEVNGTQYQTIAGDRAGFARAYDKGSYFDRFIEEHGVMLSYLSVVPFASYAYGQSRDYSRLDIFDFPFSEFATLGMDAVYTTEMAVSPFAGGLFQNTQLDSKAEVFGYQGRYYDYKANQNQEHGEMLDTQDMYTFGRKFLFGKGGKPRLNYEFVHCFPDLDMFVVNSPLEDTFRYDVYHQTAVERELPVHSIYI